MHRFSTVVLVALLASPAFAAPKTEVEVGVANRASFQVALAAKKLAPITLVVKRIDKEVSMGTQPRQVPGFIDLGVSAGWSAEEVLFVANARHEVFRVRRAEHVATTITEQLGCRAMRFAGGRGWFEQRRYALPAGFTFKGDVTIAYDTIAWQKIDATKRPDGTPCPEPSIALD
ncbi:MAG: hypothetical protein NT062_04085 [Proteobacteria bacterium]|nr:hypothetical protein [Pseudomonadota bacterium]